MKNKIAILVVDDELFNREILDEYLVDAGYEVIQAGDGEQAWDILSQRDDFGAILLDRMMPKLDGMGLLKRIKEHERLHFIPVILQTAADSAQQIAEGMREGAFYYLTKPFSKETMLAIVRGAVNDHALIDEVHGALVHEKSQISEVPLRSEYRLRTLEDAQHLATTLAKFYPQPQRVLLGLSELMLNAVEHGNLGINYKEKSQLLQEGAWEGEIERRQALPENVGKNVQVLLERLPHEVCLTVTDCGEGFNWRKYIEMSPERAFAPNGRGIAMSKMVSFDSLEYIGKGNQVVAKVKLQAGDSDAS